MDSACGLPSSSFFCGYAPFTDKSLHIVLRRSRHFERMEWCGYDTRPEWFPVETEPIDPRAPEYWDYVDAALQRFGLEPVTDAPIVGCSYREDGLTHVFVWSCVNPLSSSAPPFLALAA